MDYAKAIKTARKRAELSQRKLCDILGCDLSYVSHLEAGRRNPSVEMVAKIAAACGTTAAKIHAKADTDGPL